MKQSKDGFDERTETIAKLNDRLRQTGDGGMVVVANGVDALELSIKQRLFTAIREFDDFTPDNDPHQEHDFGVIEIDGERYFWKVDAFDLNLEYSSPNSADCAVTQRVMTILKAEEY